ncbi:MAG: hypothetical protein CBD26_02500 [Candidatus Pelagibacter sp. TMED166]|nr:MAG: hypothetical protein CBD26_02500 [Candidatus Pelagibacter sp. TMED166]|tara:strand:- start:806 stop:2122 length:1317 start_codon:yes stop_codon:yes gene_type:complete
MVFYKKNLNNLFYTFVTIHLIVWTLVPFLTNHNLPLDTIEALAWGSSLDWGFNKHPPMSALFVEIFYQIFGSNDWAYYLLSQLFVIITFFIIYKFSYNFFKIKTLSLISILLLEGIYFYNFTTPEFNVNVCQLPFWALTVYFAWKIYDKKNFDVKDCILLGIFSAFGFLSKYLFITLLISIFLLFVYMFFKKRKKFDFKYLISLEVFMVLLLPHLIWLFYNDFITIKYALDRGNIEGFKIINHLKNPLIFLLKQIGILIPFFLMVLILIKKFKIKINIKDKKLLFLFFINIVPLIIILAFSILTGSKIRTMWMTPFYLFFGILFIYILQKQINYKNLRKFYFLFIFLFFLSPFLYSFVSLTNDNKRTDYPGREIAIKVENEWNKNFEDKILIVLGDEWSAGNLSYHLNSRPKWLGFIDKNKLEKMNKFICIDDICVGN